MFKGFDAVYNRDSKALVLGSFPSVKSREAGFYYGNKQNRFWRMLEKAFNTTIPDDIEAKKAFLLKNHIALYDAVCESNLSGSADTKLSKSTFKTAQIEFLLPPFTQVEKILCNGKCAFNLIKDLPTTIPILYMPSTSPANVSFDFNPWLKELEFLLFNK